MSVRLESFQYLPVVAEGWETPELRFGRVFGYRVQDGFWPVKCDEG